MATATTGAAIVAHDGFAKIAFTGSTEVGRIIRKATAGTGKKLSLELGGKSPFIVHNEADIDAAVEGVVDAIWFNQGEVCCAGSRALVQEGIAGRFHTRLKARMEKLRMGDPLDKAIDIGAVVDPVQIENIEARVREGVASGATLVAAVLGAGHAAQGLLLSSDALHRCRTGFAARAGRSFRTGDRLDDLPHAGRSRRTCQQHPLRPCRIGLEPEPRHRLRHGATAQGGRRVDQLDQFVRCRRRIRRLPRIGLRPRRRARGHARISGARLDEQGKAVARAQGRAGALAGRRRIAARASTAR